MLPFLTLPTANYQPPGATTTRSNWESHRMTTSMIQDTNHTLDYAKKTGSAGAFPATHRCHLIEHGQGCGVRGVRN